jgi:hypothetical protein
MSRALGRTILGLAIVTVAVFGGSPAAQAQPPVAGLAARVAALQAAVASLQSAVSALQAAAGTVDVWRKGSGVVDVPRNDATFTSDWTLSTVVSLDLPAGKYFVEAKTSVQDPEVSASTFYCQLKDPSAAFFDFAVDYSVQDEPATLAVQGVVTLANPGTVALQCGTTGPESTTGDPAQAIESKIAAIKASLQ